MSALNQTASPLEVLVCDDGSTDNSRKIIEAIGDARIRWIEGPRSGRPAIPRNRGIKESRGEWLAFLDSDDEWLPQKLEKQLELANRFQYRAACSNAHRHVPEKGLAENLLTLNSDRLKFDDLLRVNSVICSSALVHKSLFPVVSGFPEDHRLKAWEDYALWLRVATQTDFAFIPEPLLMYRDDAANSIRRENTSVWKQRKAVFNDFISWGKTKGIPVNFLRKVWRQSFSDLINSRIQIIIHALTGKKM
jgi:glycosyltransferase involved in cell wall biosynthesis